MATLIKSNGTTIADYNASTIDKIKSAIKGSAMYIHIGNDNMIACNEDAMIMGLQLNDAATKMAGVPVYGDALIINKFELK